MADNENIREAIIRSLFSKQYADGSLDETYIAHLLIQEVVAGETEAKTRWLLLSINRSGQGLVHKSKENSNGTFSVGKTWKLEELQAVEAHTAISFSLKFSRRYKWTTINERDQALFLSAVIDSYRRVTGGRPLTIVGVGIGQQSQSNGRSSLDERSSARSASPQFSTSAASPSMRPVLGGERQVSNSSYASGMNGSVSAGPPSRQQYRPPPPSSLRAESPAFPDSRNALIALQIPQYPTAPSSYSSRASPSPAFGTPSQDATSSAVSRRARPSIDDTSSQRSASRNGRRSVDEPQTAQPSSSRQGSRPFQENGYGRPPMPKAPSREQLYDEVGSSRPAMPRNPSRPSIDTGSRSATPDMRRAPTPGDRRAPTPSRPLEPGLSVSASGSQLATPVYSASTTRAASPAKQPEERTTSRKETSVSRISVFDPANQATLERLLSMNVPEEGEGILPREDGEATLANVEELLDGYEWSMGPVGEGKKKGGAADMMEARLMDELLALEKANVHSFVESDDRIQLVMGFLDDAIRELDDMEMMVQSYKIQLNGVSDDISFIQSQNRGLQVQTQNQRALLGELEQLLQTVDVDREALVALTQESLEKPAGITHLEKAAAELYKALLAGRENEMAATMERLQEYQTHNSQFCKRISDFLTIMFQFQSDRLLNDKDRVMDKARPKLSSHQPMEDYLGRYCGLMLYLKEMDEDRYSQVCAAYFTASNTLHMKEMKTFLPLLVARIRKGVDDDNFSAEVPQTAGMSVRRMGTLRSPLDRKREKEPANGELKAADAFTRALNQISTQISREEEFLADFLQINDFSLTFSDYMKLENYYRRQAAKYASLSPGTIKLVREGMDLIFGFLPGELKLWVEAAMRRDNLQLPGMIFSLERLLQEVEDAGKAFFHRLLEKQHRRMYQMYDRMIDEQIKAIEQTKLTTKKRIGAAHFIKYFPVFVSRVESQLVGCEGMEIRNKVDGSYERLVTSMFECLQQMAKLDGGDSQAAEDKGQLNYHVIMIENMSAFRSDMSQLEVSSTRQFVSRADAAYQENLEAYLRLILRRAFNRLMVFFDGVEKTLQVSSPQDVLTNSAFNKSSLKRVVKDFDAKDMRKIVDALFKRVQKHFDTAEGTAGTKGETSGGSDPILPGVWKACEEEMVRQTERFYKLIRAVYADTGISLEYTIQDIQSACRRQQVS
ncbi:hypothetical protein DACRYDRAFT_101160 [Dacryopinax primogenitus]|uniref:Exocyst complex component Sec3 PIP2-binding N-terminal domain-containing protein n=1 Tax=Dacryopinax primogenitus (strain DJM 731) TaxID=1858805 RepID=M5FS40_DACPD|nr:uncharacterized protein DACRYDRAFT_101160 [Dacryopinax primogenitus]EJU00131.1 hypothetical protein DACRYDRAFT_101160 [Dacryopinax primogenitus]